MPGAFQTTLSRAAPTRDEWYPLSSGLFAEYRGRACAHSPFRLQFRYPNDICAAEAKLILVSV